MIVFANVFEGWLDDTVLNVEGNDTAQNKAMMVQPLRSGSGTNRGSLSFPARFRHCGGNKLERRIYS